MRRIIPPANNVQEEQYRPGKMSIQSFICLLVTILDVQCPKVDNDTYKNDCVSWQGLN